MYYENEQTKNMQTNSQTKKTVTEMLGVNVTVRKTKGAYDTRGQYFYMIFPVGDFRFVDADVIAKIKTIPGVKHICPQFFEIWETAN